MNVEINLEPEPEQVILGTLRTGDTFTVDGNFYMLAKEGDVEQTIPPVVNLKDGVISRMSAGQVVGICKLKAVLDRE